MPFEKGHNKGKGRPKGASNKVTQEAREAFITILEGEVEHIQAAFEKIREKNPARYLDLFAKFAQYFVPKKTEADVKGEFRATFDFNETIKKLKGDQ